MRGLQLWSSSPGKVAEMSELTPRIGDVVAERLLEDIEAVLTGTGVHADHERCQVGNCVRCSCRAIYVGEMVPR
jgi:hypothetical protein